ncbi:hypothetical protein ANCCAN_15979 [Ancylostoma caninum]|uniref:Uncharacterized protein n=1 Tax=Ancylostoma caninum TaxID=29170 RepID=A0A368G0Y5_ANCCA|nr:hypothetical protein ANCCAN_15979 [Ancylostoma caninum]
MEEQTARCVNERELPKKLEPHQRKLLVAVWWTAAGAVHHAFHRNPGAITEEWYCEELVAMHKKLPLQQRALRNSKSLVYLHDRERPNVSSVTSLMNTYVTKSSAV